MVHDALPYLHKRNVERPQYRMSQFLTFFNTDPDPSFQIMAQTLYKVVK
jgi:hypothetical protein